MWGGSRVEQTWALFAIGYLAQDLLCCLRQLIGLKSRQMAILFVWVIESF